MSSAGARLEIRSGSFYEYDPEHDVHLVDCGGKVTLETGMTRLQLLKRELAATAPNRVAKLLIDFRDTVWEDESVHMELSRLTRTELGLNPGNASIRSAIVNARWSGHISANEHWFFSVEDAMLWLCSDEAADIAARAVRRA
jgi:hypothetical protein